MMMQFREDIVVRASAFVERVRWIHADKRQVLIFIFLFFFWSSQEANNDIV